MFKQLSAAQTEALTTWNLAVQKFNATHSGENGDAQGERPESFRLLDLSKVAVTTARVFGLDEQANQLSELNEAAEAKANLDVAPKHQIARSAEQILVGTKFTDTGATAVGFINALALQFDAASEHVTGGMPGRSVKNLQAALGGLINKYAFI